MNEKMQALVYEAPHEMNLREVDVPQVKADEVLIHVAYSGICGSELSGYEGKNALRKPPLIMGHEFSGTVTQVGERVDGVAVGARVTVNPLISDPTCPYSRRGLPHLSPTRQLLSATLPGSNANYVAVRADAVYPLPDGMAMTTAALTEPAACAVHLAEITQPRPYETALVVGAGPIGLFIVQALRWFGVQTVYAADLNPARLAMAEASGAVAVSLDDDGLAVDIAVDAVGVQAVRQACVNVTNPAGRVIWIGLHSPDASLPVNAMIRSEIATYGSFGYTPTDFARAIDALAAGDLWLDETWTRTEPLANGSACFEELIGGADVAKIWLEP